MTLNKWEIWLVDMPFDEGISSKIRPALVIDIQGDAVIAGKMTTHAPRGNYLYEYEVQEWKEAGLNFPTTLRLSKILTLDKERFKKKLGSVQPVDQINIRNLLMQIIEQQ